MSILNYTTKVPVAKTMGEVTAMLVKSGARQVMTEYDDDGSPAGLTFSVDTELGMRGFTLPVRAGAVEKLLANSPRSEARGTEQSHRVAWRIIKDWLEAQLALIETDMVTFDQVMLPYMRSAKGGTFYEQYLIGDSTAPALNA